jgi:hypothetical protein
MFKNILPLSSISSPTAPPRCRKKRGHAVRHVTTLSVENQLLAVAKLITARAKGSNQNSSLARIRE